MRFIAIVLVAASATALVAACSPKREGNGGDGGGPADACVGLQCRVANCTGMPSDTTIKGTVYAPNGTLPLSNVTVYVPNVDPGTFPAGVQCDRCQGVLPGEPVVQTVSDANGDFTLTGVPVGTDVPLILTVGKWRRRALIPTVTSCTTTMLDATTTSLPSKASQGELPDIAITTGGADALECLPKKLGVDISEFNNGTGTGHIHMFTSDIAADTDSFAEGGATYLASASSAKFPKASTLWNSLDQLKKYDVVMMSCEGDFDTTNKSKDAMDNVKQYADLGGRIFLEHYHATWITGDKDNTAHAPAVWPNLMTLDSGANVDVDDRIDTNVMHNPKELAFSMWMEHVGASSGGQIPVSDGRQTTKNPDLTRIQQWVYDDGSNKPQIIQYTTPIEADEGERCGRVVFSDMHVSSGSTSSPSEGFPMGCTGGDLTEQEKALAFIFFDIASCVQIVN